MKPYLLLLLLFFANTASAQIVGGQWEMMYQFDGAVAGDDMGTSVSGAGDVNSDGFADLIVGAPFVDPSGRNDAGSAYVYSGATGSLLWQFDGGSPDDQLGWSVSGAGDVDGDGFDDVIVGAPRTDIGIHYRAGSAYVYSGATGVLIWQFDSATAFDYFGSSVSSAGDVDGDSLGDLIVGADNADPGGRVKAGSAFVYSGATGVLIWRFDGTAPKDHLGNSVSAAGDVDGDGFDDLIVGANWADPGGRLRAGSAFVFSGRTGTKIRRFRGLTADDHLGSSVSGAGDVDGDGFADLIVGAQFADPGSRHRAGSAYVYSGVQGAPLIWQFDGATPGDCLGVSVAGMGDVDGDGFSDLIVGASGANAAGGRVDAGSAYIYSGATGVLIWQFDGAAAYDQLGGSVSGAGDVNDDGLYDVIVGAFRADPGGVTDAGSAYVWSLNPYLHTKACELSASSGTPVTIGLDFPVSEAGIQYAILACISGTGPTTIGGIEVPLTGDTMLQRMLIGWSPRNMTGAFGVLNVNGDARATIASDPILAPHIGKTYYLAAITYDGLTQTGRLSSIARKIEIMP